MCFFLTEKEGLDFAVPVFLLAYASRFGSKIRPLQLSQLAVSVPDGARWLPPRGRFGFIPLRQQTEKTGIACLFVFGGEGGIFCELRRLPCDSIALSLPPFRKPVAGKTVPRTVFLLPFKSLPIKTTQPCFARLFCFGGEGGI